MDDNRIGGAARDTFGRAQESVGDVMGDQRMKARGAVNQAQGQAENAAGQLSDVVRDQPLTAVMIGVAIGYILGRLRIL